MFGVVLCICLTWLCCLYDLWLLVCFDLLLFDCLVILVCLQVRFCWIFGLCVSWFAIGGVMLIWIWLTWVCTYLFDLFTINTFVWFFACYCVVSSLEFDVVFELVTLDGFIANWYVFSWFGVVCVCFLVCFWFILLATECCILGLLLRLVLLPVVGFVDLFLAITLFVVWFYCFIVLAWIWLSLLDFFVWLLVVAV